MENILVVAGGRNDGRQLHSVELLYLNENGTHNQGWVTGPDLPFDVSGSRMIEYKKSVIILGGVNPEGPRQHLHQLSSPNGPWTEMMQTLKSVGYFQTAFLVPDEIVNCHKWERDE